MFGGWLYRKQRRRLGLGAIAIAGAWIAWNEAEVPSAFRGVRAPQPGPLAREAGLKLFEHEWTVADTLSKGDGLGPVFNDRSCVACHSQGGIGGGGGIEHNVTTFEAHPVPGRPEVQGGIIHAFSVSSDCQESRHSLNDFFQVVPGGVTIVGTCFVQKHDFDPVRSDSINSTALFGAGWVDQITDRAITHNARLRAMASLGQVIGGNLESVPAGRARILPDGRIGKFGWKAQFATLKEFVAAACANEIGLGNPLMEQARPYAHHATQKVERDLDELQFRSLVAYVGTLARPIEVMPSDSSDRIEAERGRVLFEKVGCTVCHVSSLGGVDGVYSDFLLHRLTSSEDLGGYREVPQVELPTDHPLADEWKTPALWGVADSAPYFHDGKSPTLRAAIDRHQGDASAVTRGFVSLSERDQNAVIAFLSTLKAPRQEKPAPRKHNAPADYFAMTR